MATTTVQLVKTLMQSSRFTSSREATPVRTTNAKPRPSFLSTLLRTLSAFAA